MNINYFAVPGLPTERYTPEMLKIDIANYYNIPPSQMHSKCRKKEFVEARQVAFYWLNIHFGLSLAEAGAFLGGRDHSTGTHSIRIIDEQYIIDRELRKRFDDLRSIVKPKIRRLKPYNGRVEALLKNLEYSEDHIKLN
jgi:chromosomal replication initiation ATPase DnaA